ncbi:MAG: hypothetical protein AAF849_25245 [Bacteroidota bacterium]
MSDSKSNNGLFWLGLGLGLAAGYFLNSDKGRQLQKDASKKAVAYGNQIKETGQQQIDQLSNNVNRWIEQGQSYAKDLQAVAQENINKINPTSSSASESAFQRGKLKAQAAIEVQEEKIKQAIEKQK